MKRRIFGVLLMFLLMMSIGLSVSAATKETYIDENEDGVPEYCWVRGKATEKPTQKIQGYTWIAVLDGNRQVTQIGACDEHGIVNHDCGDMWDRAERLEYKWELVVKELLVISSRDEAGYSMEGSAFMLLKENIERDENGNPVIYTDENGEECVKRIVNEYGHESDVVICKAYVGEDGYATLRLKKEDENDNRLDWTKEFQQLVLVQNLNPDPDIPIEESPLLQEYMSLNKRWYVNLILDDDGNYEVYSITEAPANQTNNYKELKEYHFDELVEGFVDEYNTQTQIMYLRNAFRVGNVYVNINVEGFQEDVPYAVSTNAYVDITGPHDFSKRVRKTSTLEDMRMGDYTIKWPDPVTATGYTERDPEVKVTLLYPVTGETMELTGDINTLTLSREQANAEIAVTYTYYPNHVHTWDEGVVTDPTCTEKGYTTYTCTGYDSMGEKCNETKQGNYVAAFGHSYEETIVEPTCNEDGYKVYTCVDCGDTYTKPGDPAIEHEYETVVTKPACEKEGYTTYTCIHCGFSYKDDYTDPIGHAYKHTGDVDVSCEEDGKKIFTCENCGDTLEEITGEATGHKPVFSKVIDPTCTESGYNLYICSNCNKELEEKRDDLPATGHSYGNVVVTDPTCTEKGYTTYTCTKDGCGYSYKGDYKDALGHSYTSQVIEPTKDREGYTLHTCSVCKDSYTDNYKDKLSSSSSNKGSSDKSDKAASSSGSSGSSGSSSGSSQSAGNGSSANISGSATDALVVKFFDEDNQPLNSGMVALYEGSTQLKSWSCTYDNVVVVDNLEKYAKDGQVVSYTLKQSKAMDGYETSNDSFTVQIQKQGSNLTVNVKKNGNIFTGASKKSSVETGRDGKPIVTIYNTKETTRFSIACQVSVEFEGDTLLDEAVIAEYQQKQYKFTLRWTDEEGEEKSESLTLVNGTSDSWRAEIPFGTAYEITAEDEDGNVLTGLSENASGTLTAKQMDEKVKVEAAIKYQIQDASPKKVEVTVIDPKNDTPLRGANFELRDPDGEKIATYISRENGKFYMEDVFTELGEYLLTQTKASEGYATISGAIPIKVSQAYEPKSENNAQILLQTKAVEFAHQAVSEEEDGSFTIKNDTYELVIAQSEEKGGKTGLILGIVGGALALGASAAAFVMIKKKRRRNGAEDVENVEDAEV